MKNIQSTAEAILQPVKVVEGIVEKRQTLPILSHLLIEQNGKTVKFSSTDLDIQISTVADVGVEECEARYTVAADTLASIISAIPPSEIIDFDWDEEKRLMSVNRKVGSFQLKTLSANDYPILKEGKWHTSITIPANRLRHLLTMTQFAMASQDVRFFLNGVLLVVNHKMVCAVATDTHRLAYCETELSADSGAQIESIIPRKTVRELTRILPEDDTPVIVQMTDTQICFKFDNVSFMSKLVEGKFPDYRRVLPSEDATPRKITLNREALMNVLRRIAIMITDKFNGVRWILDGKELRIQSANNNEEEAYELMELESPSGDMLDMGFNITYLMDVLNILKTKEVTFHFSSPTDSVLITTPESEGRFRYVVMPMRL